MRCTVESHKNTYTSSRPLTGYKLVPFEFYRLQMEQRPSLTPSLERYRYCMIIISKVLILTFSSLSRSLCLIQSEIPFHSLFSFLLSCSFKSTMTSSWETWSSTCCRPETWPRGTTMATLTHLSKSTSCQGEGESRVWTLSRNISRQICQISVRRNVIFPSFFLPFFRHNRRSDLGCSCVVFLDIQTMHFVKPNFPLILKSIHNGFCLTIFHSAALGFFISSQPSPKLHTSVSNI